MTLLPSRLLSPRAALTTAGSRLRAVLTLALDAAQALVDRLPEDGPAAPADGARFRATTGAATGRAVPTIGSDRRRRHHSRASRSLAR